MTVAVKFRWGKARIVTSDMTYVRFGLRLDGDTAHITDLRGNTVLTLAIAEVTTVGKTARIVGTNGDVWVADAMGCGCGVTAHTFPTVEIPQ